MDHRGRVDHPSRELRAEVFDRFHAALEPLRDAGKLGGILMQFPPYVVMKPASLEYIEWAQEQLGGDEMLVEFRHRSWLEDDAKAETLAFLERRGATYVMVDAPRTEAKNLVPTVVGATSRPPTCACTVATPRPGTTAAGAPPSASTTSTRPRSWPSGRSRCGGSRRCRSGRS